MRKQSLLQLLSAPFSQLSVSYKQSDSSAFFDGACIVFCFSVSLTHARDILEEGPRWESVPHQIGL